MRVPQFLHDRNLFLDFGFGATKPSGECRMIRRHRKRSRSLSEQLLLLFSRIVTPDYFDCLTPQKNIITHIQQSEKKELKEQEKNEQD